MAEDALDVRVIDALCLGCGSCVAACPNKATRRTRGQELRSWL